MHRLYAVWIHEGKETTNVIITMWELHKKYNGKKKDLSSIFVDLKKTFDRIPRKVHLWSMRKLDVHEWIVSTAQAMYENARSKVCVSSKYSSKFNERLGYMKVLY